MVGLLAKAKAGHDKDQWYIVIEETEEYVWLADGKYKPVEKPKRKNKKHIQLCRRSNSMLRDIQAKLQKQEKVRNEEIKRAIKLLNDSDMQSQKVEE